MRNAFVQELLNLATVNDKIVLLTADLGFSVLEDFQRKFPDRFYNVGVSEQNMVGLATGLAEAGYIPFIYSIGPFSLLRPYEFIKNGPILHNLPVRIISIGPGFEYGDLGATHHLLEDIALTRVYPNLTTYSPINSLNAAKLLNASFQDPGPIYYRIGKNKVSLSDNKNYRESKHIIELSNTNNSKTCILTIGSMVEEAITALNELEDEEIYVSAYAIKKIDTQLQIELAKILNQFTSVITVESHYINGGIGSMVAEVIAETNMNVKLHRLGVKTLQDGNVGSAKFMHKKFGISCNHITSIVRDIISEQKATL